MVVSFGGEGVTSPPKSPVKERNTDRQDRHASSAEGRQASDGSAKSTPVEQSVNAAHKRSRERGHSAVEINKTTHIRTKTGCGTCRLRKKKCDERRPTCTNCEKNNFACTGYEPRQPWRRGKQEIAVASVQQKAVEIPAELPMLVNGIDGKADQTFFIYFTSRVGKVLSLTDHSNPFLETIVPIAMGHAGLMHSLLFLSGSCLVANEPSSAPDWSQRQAYHSSKAIRILNEAVKDATARGESNAANFAIDDPSIAQTLVLCLQTICVGDVSGSYRYHLNAMKTMLSQQGPQHPPSHLRQFILEFLLYHDYGNSITSLTNPVDNRSLNLMQSFTLPDFATTPQVATLLGVKDGLFDLLSRIRQVRDIVRSRRRHPCAGLPWWDPPVFEHAFAIDQALRDWQCLHPPDSPRYAASLLYRQCAWIYLHRTVMPSRASPTFRSAIDEGLRYLRLLHWDSDHDENSLSTKTDTKASAFQVPCSTPSVLLMPLFLLGCAAFEPSQRPELSAAFDRLQRWSNFGNIKHARVIVEKVWEMIDEGKEEETWDWESIIADRGWDFLVT